MIKKIYELLLKVSPLFYTLLIVIPLGCSLFITNKNFTETSKICVIIVVAIISLITYLVSEKNILIERAQNKLSVEVLKGERDITKHRRDTILISFKNALRYNEMQQKLNYDPYEKISFILQSISLCFETFMEIRPKYVSVTIFYHFDYQQKDDWFRLDKNYCKVYMNNSEVILDEDSFGRYVMEGTEDFYLINNKYRDGVKEKNTD